MKATRKLIPALALLLISAIMLSTASYAWLSMNTSVTASGMQITANSDYVYLLIQNADEATFAALETDAAKLNHVKTNAANRTSHTFLPVSQSSLLPSAWKKAATAVTDAAGNPLGSTKASGTTGVGAEIGTATKWYKANAAAFNASAAKEDSGVALTATAFDDYVKVYNYKLTLVDGSNPVAANTLKVNYKSTITDSAEGKTAVGVRVLVVCGDNYYEFSGIQGGDGEDSTFAINAAAIEDDGFTNITVYVYYDGNDASVYTDNAANLVGATFTLTFFVEE